MLAGIVRKFMVAQAEAASLATYDFGTGEGEAPAVFTMRTPDDAGSPCAFVALTATEPWGTRGRKGHYAKVTVTFRGEQRQNAEEFATLCEQWSTRLNRADLSELFPVGYSVGLLIADLPTIKTDGGHLVGAIETRIRLLLPG